MEKKRTEKREREEESRGKEMDRKLCLLGDRW